MKRALTTLCLLIIYFSNAFSSHAQHIQLSDRAAISVITYGPGNALYEKFGHTAIRVRDTKQDIDWVYNYGIFDFNEANFYVNFVRGYMKYRLAVYPFPPTLHSYNRDERWVKEQILNLNTTQKQAFFNLLSENAKPENRSYFYDPYFNNCSTKPRDLIEQVIGKPLTLDSTTPSLSLRQLMNREIHPNTWGSVGINIALGNTLDGQISPRDYLYLPDYVFESLAQTEIQQGANKEPLVAKTLTILPHKTKEIQSDGWSSPLVFIGLFSLFITWTSYRDYQRKRRSKWLDITLFVGTGIFGVLLVFLWFFTNHSTAPNNFNTLWAFAPNLFIAFYIGKKNTPKWLATYSVVLLCLLAFIPLVWALNWQQFAYPLTSLFVALSVRYTFLWYAIKNFE